MISMLDVLGRIVSFGHPVDLTARGIVKPLGSTGQTLVVNAAGDKLEWGTSGSGGGGVGVALDNIWDAVGDLAIGSGANAAQRLPVGSDGQTLLADSSQSLGVRWGPAGGHDAVTLAADADVLLGLNTQELQLDSQNPNTVFAGPSSGSVAADPTFRALEAADLNGIAAGGDLTGTYPNPSVSIDHSDLGGIGADDHHAAVTLNAAVDALLGLSGQQLTLDSQQPNYALIGPSSGSTPASPTFRRLVAGDLATGGSTGTKWLRDDMTWQSASFHDALTLDTDAQSFFQLTSQVFEAKDLLVNRFYAGPSTGVSGAPTPRRIVHQDLASGGGGTTKFLREDMTWQTVSTGGSLAGARATTDGTHNGTIAFGAERLRFDTVTFDPRGAVTTGASWVFTAPDTGYYQVSVAVLAVSAGGALDDEACWLTLYRNGAAYARLDRETVDPNGHFNLQGSDLVQLDAGQTLYVELENNTSDDVSLESTTPTSNYIAIHKVVT